MKCVFKLGIMGAGVSLTDDLFEAEVELTQEEYDSMLPAYEKYMWDDDDLSEMFRDYLPELNEKICSLAEPFAVAKYGETARRENGAWYEVCDPDFIEEAYEGSQAETEFHAAQKRMQTNCKSQSNYEVGILKGELSKGRWPHFTDAGPYHLFDCFRCTGGMEASYSMNGRCNGMTIDYCKRYTLRVSKMEITFYGSKVYAKRLIDEYLATCGRDIEVKDMDSNTLVYIPSKEDATDIEILLPILDKMELDAKEYNEPECPKASRT